MKIDKTYTVPFSVAKTYAAWTSSDTVIAPATRMNVDPIVGGLYQLFVENGDTTYQCEGLFDIVEVENRLRYTWQWGDELEISVVEVIFSADGDGTQIKLSHTGFSTQESCDKHAKGWDAYIEGFTAFVAG